MLGKMESKNTMSKKVYLLKLPDCEIAGIVSEEKYAQEWVDGTDDREYVEYELNKVKCDECKHDWKFKK